MEGEVLTMLWPLIVATALFSCSLLSYGAAIHVIVRVVVRLLRSSDNEPGWGFWQTIAVMAIVSLMTTAAHLTQITLWAVALLLCGQCSAFESAFYFSAENFTALG